MQLDSRRSNCCTVRCLTHLLYQCQEIKYLTKLGSLAFRLKPPGNTTKDTRRVLWSSSIVKCDFQKTLLEID